MGIEGAGRWPHQETVRHALAAAACALTLIVLWQPSVALVNLGLHDDRSSHILVIPFLSALVVGFRRKSVFTNVRYSPAAGILFIGFIILWYALQPALVSLPVLDRLSCAAAVMVALWLTVFLA